MSGDDAMGVLKTNAGFQSFITHTNNPILGIIVGIIICSVLQSSSASIGILQMLAMNELMPMSFAFYLIIGVNVGSAMPLFLSAIGAKTNAKRAALIYFIFDFVGLLIFTPIALFTPFISMIEGVSPNGSVQVAAGHIVFKVVTALGLLPFVKYIVKISEMLIKPKAHETELRFQYIDRKITSNTLTVAPQIGKEVERMALLSRKNFVIACEGFLKMDTSREREIRDNEELINWLNHHISDFMVTVTSYALPAQDSEYIGRLFHVITDLERIGDHALNVLERTELAQQSAMVFSDEAFKNFQEIYEKALELLDRSIGAFVNMHLSADEEHELHALEDSIDHLTIQAQDAHVERLRKKECSTASGVLYTKLLQDLERVGDHSYNIAWAARKDKNLIRQI